MAVKVSSETMREMCAIISSICQAGVSVGSVLVDGAISACPSIRADYHQGNIYKDDFMEVWNNKYQPYRGPRVDAQRGVCRL